MSKNNQQTYWRSLNELARNEEYKKFVTREFPENADELKEGYSRRNFLQIMGASIALAGFAACRKPVSKIVPFTNMPEYMVPGKPVYYATSIPSTGYVTGLVVETNSGRPTKIEGNELHPSSKGATNLFQQAAILGLYDPDRSRGVRNNGALSSWESFVSELNSNLSETSRIAFIGESNSSLTLNRLRQQALARFGNAQWVTYEPFGEENQLLGSKIALGRKLRVASNLQHARVIISLDADFMGSGADNVRNIRSFAEGRKINSTEDSINRLYVVESNLSLTGSNADHRLRLKPSQIKPFLVALAALFSNEFSSLRGFAGTTNDFSEHEWVNILGEELLNNQGSSLLMAGADHDAETHALVAAINIALGNAGNTVDYLELPHTVEDDQHAKFISVVNGMRNGQFDAVIMLGTNPVFTAPTGIDFAGALRNVPLSVHLADYVDETSRLVTWHINRAHFLEYWGDGYDFMGTPSVIQPMIQPLFNGKSEIEVLGAVVAGESISGSDAVKDTWKPILGNGFDARWSTLLHDGLHSGLTFRNAAPSMAQGFSSAITGIIRSANTTSAAGSIEINIKPDATLWDGRYANNGWLMELPDPMTKITWDNVALVSPTTAEKLGISKKKFGDTKTSVIRLQVDGVSLELPAWILPGHADDVITVNAGYGRSDIGRVADGVGVNVYPLLASTNSFYRTSTSVTLSAGRYDIASVQDHHSLEGRPIIREASIDEYRKDPRFAADMVYVPGKKGDSEFAVALFTPQSYPNHEPQWGMTIDLTSCIGCGVCTIACQAENNIPVIGKEEVRRGREMHWMRNDRYFSGDEYGDVKVLHQPVTCVHCELAPCEQVCPVAATTHSDDGINQMTYNRCIGTRYCANNCPFKVRRFNFFNYPLEYLTSGDDPEVIQMAMNPDVSIRFRGIMEKCTYCVQRISRAKIATKLETGNSIKPADGMVKTACQQACPANAITFGDLTDSNSVVSKAKRNERNYVVLEELNIRPRTTYLAKIRNTNEKLA
jgi:MoCo/4Fe-4S cofactor protein with predicted Tat translocation signal